MMNDIDKFIEKYKGVGTEQLLSQPDLEADIDSIKAKIGDCDPARRQEVEQILRPLYDAMDAHISDLKAEMAQGLETIERVRKTSEACIAYLKASKE